MNSSPTFAADINNSKALAQESINFEQLSNSTQDPNSNSTLNSNEDFVLSPQRRNFERFRKSMLITHQLSVKKLSDSCSDTFNPREKTKRSLSLKPCNSTDDSTDRKDSSESHLSLGSLSVFAGSDVDPADQLSPYKDSLLANRIRNLSIFSMIEESCDSKIRESIHFIDGNFKEFYCELETLGQGCSGIVKKFIHIPSSQTYAVKIIETMGEEERILQAITQFRKRKELFHRYIVNMYEIYIDMGKNKIYTVMELVEAPDLQKSLEEFGKYSEQSAATIVKQVLLAVQYLHVNGACHRDLKLENILASADGKLVKILDFDVSKFTKKEEKYSALNMENMKMWTKTGTEHYIAPEVFEDQEYTEAIDMWSMGVVVYSMLTGHLPFKSENKHDLILEITSGEYWYEPTEWESLSGICREFVESLLIKDYKRRLTPFEALAHKWVHDNTDSASDFTAFNLEEICSPLRLRKISESKRNSGTSPKTKPSAFARGKQA